MARRVALYLLYLWVFFCLAFPALFLYHADMTNPLEIALLTIRFDMPFTLCPVAFLCFCNLVYLICVRFIGFHAHVINIGPLKIIREWNGWRLRVHWESWTFGVETYTADERNLPRRLIIASLIAPCTCLLLGVIATIAGIVRYQSSRRIDLGIFLLGVTVTMCLFVVVHALRPLRSPGKDNARSLIAMILANGPRADRLYAWTVLYGAMFDGERPRDWRPDLVRRVMIPSDGSHYELGALINVLYYAFDANDFVSAGNILTRLRALYEQHQPLYRDTIYAEAAFYQAFVHRNAASARTFANIVKWGHRSKRSRARVEAAILLAEGKHAEAWERAVQGNALPDHVTWYGFYRAEQDWLTAIMARAMDAAPFAMPPVAPVAAPPAP